MKHIAILLVGLVIVLSASERTAAQSPAGVCENKASVSATEGGTWEPRKSPTLHRSETASAVLDNQLYVAGGLAGAANFYTEITRSFEVYNPADDTWKELAILPVALHHIGLVGAHGHVYLTGGYTALDFIANTKSAWSYDPKTNAWAAIADMPVPRAAHSMVAINDTIYLVGGVTAASSQLWTYDPVGDKWDTHHKPMPTPREHMALAVLDNKLYALGGETPNSDGTGNETYEKLAANEVYDPASDSWKSLAMLPTARSSITAVAMNGQIHVVSGENVQDSCVFPQHDVYDPKTDKWMAMAALPIPRHGAVSGVIDGRWYVVDGATSPGLFTIATLSNAVEVFIPAKNS